MLRDKDGNFNYCPFRFITGAAVFSECLGAACCAYDVIPAEYSIEGKPIERCLMMQQPFYPAPCCGPVTTFEDAVEVTPYKEDRENE